MYYPKSPPQKQAKIKPRNISDFAGEPSNDTPKEAKLHEGSASSVRRSGLSFSGFTSDAIPNAARVTFSSPPTHAGNLYVLPFYGQDEIIIPHHGGMQAGI